MIEVISYTTSKGGLEGIPEQQTALLPEYNDWEQGRKTR